MSAMMADQVFPDEPVTFHVGDDIWQVRAGRDKTTSTVEILVGPSSGPEDRMNRLTDELESGEFAIASSSHSDNAPSKVEIILDELKAQKIVEVAGENDTEKRYRFSPPYRRVAFNALPITCPRTPQPSECSSSSSSAPPQGGRQVDEN